MDFREALTRLGVQGEPGFMAQPSKKTEHCEVLVQECCEAAHDTLALLLLADDLPCPKTFTQVKPSSQKMIKKLVLQVLNNQVPSIKEMKTAQDDYRIRVMVTSILQAAHKHVHRGH